MEKIYISPEILNAFYFYGLLQWIGLVALSKESHYKSGKIFAKGLDFIWK